MIAVSFSAASAASAASSVVMYSDPGDYVGGGHMLLFDDANGSVGLTGTASSLSIAVRDSDNNFRLDFAAPPGQTLAPGYYRDAQVAEVRTDGHPGVDIGGDARGCDSVIAAFQVKDIATDSAGNVTRLSLAYEQHCQSDLPATWGEVQIGEPSGPGLHSIPAAAVRWPATDAGSAGSTVPVTLEADSAPEHIAGVAVNGSGARDFSVQADGCTGQSLAPGATCQVWLRFVPHGSGVSDASLSVTDSAGHAAVSPLQGLAHGGSTSARIQSDPGDYVGLGQDVTFTPTAPLLAGGNRQGVVYLMGEDFRSEFFSAPGDSLTAGTTYPDAQDPFNGSAPGIEVFGEGRACDYYTGDFTVTALTFYADGLLQSLGVSFDQHCQGEAAALHGTLDYRVGDSTPEDLWSPTSDTGAAPGTQPGGSPGTQPGGSQSPPANPGAISPGTKTTGTTSLGTTTTGTTTTDSPSSDSTSSGTTPSSATASAAPAPAFTPGPGAPTPPGHTPGSPVSRLAAIVSCASPQPATGRRHGPPTELVCLLRANSRGERVRLRLRRHGSVYATATVVGTGRAQSARLSMLRRLVAGTYRLEVSGPRGTQSVTLPITVR